MTLVFQSLFYLPAAIVFTGFFFLLGQQQVFLHKSADSLDTFEFEVKDNLKLSDNGKIAFHYLKSAKQFETSRIGAAARYSKYYDAYSILLHEKDSNSVFKKLFNQGTVAVKLYSVFALKANNDIESHPIYKAIQSSHKKVQVLARCVVSHFQISDINLNGDYDWITTEAQNRFRSIKNQWFDPSN